MIDNDPNNDEYKLDDLDLLASEPEDQPKFESDPLTPEPQEYEEEKSMPIWQNPTFKKGLIAVGCVILLVLCYQMLASFFSGNTTASKDTIKPVTVISKPLNIVSPVVQMPQQVTPEVDKKISALEQEQSAMNNNIQTMNNQVSSMTGSVSSLSTKMTELSNTISILNQKLDTQTQEIERLIAEKAKKRRVVAPRKLYVGKATPLYYIQAVIPGRAWLMTSNGGTLTVREGSLIAGYGVVRLIDPEQGRVMTSSGRVIRFSQVDN